MNTLSILTLNCQKAYHPDLDGFIERILRSEKYDFILLQEVTSPIIDTISKATGSYKILNPFDSIIENSTGVAVIYKEKFTLTDPLFLSFARVSHKVSPRGWGFAGGIFTEGENK